MNPESTVNPLILSQWWGRREYTNALAEMESAQSDRRAGSVPDTMFYLEHEPVITAGRATPSDHILVRDIPVHEVGRGGMATYHGPGQLVGYGIIDLQARRTGPPDIHVYLRALEEGIIQFLLAEYRLVSKRIPEHTGVWIEDESGARKIASIGVSARRWVTGHGFALNVACDLTAFDRIVPCGIADCVMTSVERELEMAYVPASMSDVAEFIHPFLCQALHDVGYGATE